MLIGLWKEDVWRKESLELPEGLHKAQNRLRKDEMLSVLAKKAPQHVTEHVSVPTHDPLDYSLNSKEKMV